MFIWLFIKSFLLNNFDKSKKIAQSRDLSTSMARVYRFECSRGRVDTGRGIYDVKPTTQKEKERERWEKRLNHTFELLDLERARSYLHLNFVLRNCFRACDFIPRGRISGYFSPTPRHSLTESDRIAENWLRKKTQSGARVS